MVDSLQKSNLEIVFNKKMAKRQRRFYGFGREKMIVWKWEGCIIISSGSLNNNSLKQKLRVKKGIGMGMWLIY